MSERSRLLISIVLTTSIFSSCTYRFYPSACDYPVPGRLVMQTVLDSAVSETSGLLYLEGNIWTFNDSGGEPALYCVDQQCGSVIRKTIIRNATNVDWEDMAEDSTFIYVADVGNNYATRDTTVIYRIRKTGLLSGDPQLTHEGIISLSFDKEISRTRSGLSSNDCEALLVFGDSLFLFSKDWVHQSTSVFIFPKEPGHYCLSPSKRYDARLLVTGADLYTANKQVSLVGYRDYMPVVVTYKYGDSPALISCGGKARIYPLKVGRQVEGICYDPTGHLYISAEKTLRKQALFKVDGPKR